MTILRKLNKGNNIYILIYTNMKKIWLLTTLLFGSFLLVGCNNTVNNPEIAVEDDCVLGDNNTCTVEIEEPEVTDVENGNSLILVFSPTGNTRRMAGYISELTNIELTEIIPVIPYTEDDLNWRNEESRTFKEFKDNTIRPEIETQINIDGYDTIYLWFPIWFGITPNIILTLLENYDFSGKNIVLFCTSEHVGIEKAVEYLEPYNLNVIASHRFAQDTTKEEVQEWLESL